MIPLKKETYLYQDVEKIFDMNKKYECAWDSGCDEKDFLRLFGEKGVRFYLNTLTSKGDNFRFIDAEMEQWRQYRKKEPTDPSYRQWLGLDGAGKQLKDIIKSINKN